MSRYFLSGEALAELDDIWEYIAQDDIEAANRWVAKLLDACELLAQSSGRPYAQGSHRDFFTVLARRRGARDNPSYLRRRT
jgi:plasmid stabilization system protein ParE